MPTSKLPSTGGPQTQLKEALLHPLALLALFSLLLNDHWLKGAYPGWVSGKLSDFAGLLLLPLWLAALWQWLALLLAPRVRFLSEGRWLLGVAIVFSGALFVSMEVTTWGDWAFRHLLGWLQWPFRWLWAWLNEGAQLQPRPVVATPDVSDLIALPVLGVAWWIGRQYFTGNTSPVLHVNAATE